MSDSGLKEEGGSLGSTVDNEMITNEETTGDTEHDRKSLSTVNHGDIEEEMIGDNGNERENSGCLMDMLKLIPRKRLHNEESISNEENEQKRKKIDLEETVVHSSSSMDEMNVTPPQDPPTSESAPSLVKLFKKDPDTVLDLLSKVISMESLSELLKKEHQDNLVHLKTLKEKVEKAHGVLSQCSEKKKELLDKIEIVKEEIQMKRNQLTQTREELRELSMEESKVKEKRDNAYERCCDLRQKVQGCREAVTQIQNLYHEKNKKREKKQRLVDS
jgi:vacuolar-type H+-ATPase subunit I/STV1